MNKTNIAVLVSGGGTNLQALIDAENSGIITSGKIKLVVSSNSEAYALERAKKANIKTAVIVRKGNPDFEKELITVLMENNIELIVLALSAALLPGSYLDFVFPFNKLNVVFPFAFLAYYVIKTVVVIVKANKKANKAKGNKK